MFFHLRKWVHLKSTVTVVVVMWAHFFLPPDVSEGAELVKHCVPPTSQLPTLLQLKGVLMSGEFMKTLSQE